jgi:hypothetical protein
MTLERAIEILEQYQKWRVGDIENYPVRPHNITEAIETILKHLKK